MAGFCFVLFFVLFYLIGWLVNWLLGCDWLVWFSSVPGTFFFGGGEGGRGGGGGCFQGNFVWKWAGPSSRQTPFQ